VGDSNLVEIYDGKVYHLCCPDCHKDFEKDPAKFAAAVAGNPGNYGVK
jgi:YHS domain-containing protein